MGHPDQSTHLTYDPLTNQWTRDNRYTAAPANVGGFPGVVPQAASQTYASTTQMQSYPGYGYPTTYQNQLQDPQRGNVNYTLLPSQSHPPYSPPINPNPGHVQAYPFQLTVPPYQTTQQQVPNSTAARNLHGGNQVAHNGSHDFRNIQAPGEPPILGYTAQPFNNHNVHLPHGQPVFHNTRTNNDVQFLPQYDQRQTYGQTHIFGFAQQSHNDRSVHLPYGQPQAHGTLSNVYVQILPQYD